MSINNEVIKFQVIQSRSVILIDIDLSQFILCRENLQNEELIGRIKTSKFAGYDCGNISIRLPKCDKNGNKHFYIAITGSQTSSKKEFSLSDLAVIESYEPKNFAVKYSGIAIPSSETPLHWTSYETDPRIRAIIHAHILENNPLYEQMPDFFLRHQLPLTYRASKGVEIGEEIARLIKKRGCSKIVGMLNHDGGFGLLSFGENLEEAYLKILNFYKQLKKAVG